MPLLNKARAGVLWSMGGHIGFAAFSWLATLMLARLDPSGGVVGQFGIASAITFPIVVFCSLQLRSVVVSDARGEFSFSDYLGFRLLSVVATWLAIFFVGLFRSEDHQLFLSLMALGLAKVADGVADMFHAYLQRHGRIDRMATSFVLRGICTVAGISLGFRLFSSLPSAILLMACLLFAETLIYEVWAIARTSHAVDPVGGWRSLKPRFSRTMLLRVGKVALPLGLASLVGAFGLQLPVYIIDHQLGRAAQGRFSVIYGPMMAMPIFVVAAQEGVFNQLAGAAAARNIELWRHLLGRLIGLALVLGLGLVGSAILFGKTALALVYGRSYAESSNVLVWLAVGVGLGFIATVLSSNVIANRRFRLLLLMSLVQLPVSTLLIFGLVRTFGPVGSAYALVVGQLISIAIYWCLAALWLRQARSAQKAVT